MYISITKMVMLQIIKGNVGKMTKAHLSTHSVK